MDYRKKRLLSEDLPLFVHPPFTYANTFDASIGGLMKVLLTEDGQYYQHTESNVGRALVIEVGGFIIDCVAVNPVIIHSLIT
jgi:hypothetical protein